MSSLFRQTRTIVTNQIVTPGLLARASNNYLLESFKEVSQLNIYHMQKAGYKKRQTSKLVHVPNFDEYDKLPGDEFQTAYVGYYDDKRHNEPRALDRFYRLNWGGWIRARGGRGSGHWKKNSNKMWWARQHVLCNATQSEQLEKMFEKKYRNKTYFVDDPYEVYEDRRYEFLPTGHRPYSYSYVKAKDYVE